MGISAAQLARMRTQVNGKLPDSCVISTQSYTTDGSGFSTPTPSVAGTVDCRLDPMRNLREMVQVNEALGRETLSAMYRLTTPYDSPLAEDCLVVTGGKTYQVVQLDDVHSWNVAKRAIVVEVR